MVRSALAAVVVALAVGAVPGTSRPVVTAPVVTSPVVASPERAVPEVVPVVPPVVQPRGPRSVAHAAAASDDRAAVAVDAALAQLGLPYVWGGDGPTAGDTGFDCSGLTHFAYAVAGIDLPRTAHTQYHAGPRVPAGAPLLPGDLVFYGVPERVHHVGLYLGDGRMVNAPRFGKPVQVAYHRWPGDDYLGATRPAASDGPLPSVVAPLPLPIPGPEVFEAPPAPLPDGLVLATPDLIDDVGPSTASDEPVEVAGPDPAGPGAGAAAGQAAAPGPATDPAADPAAGPAADPAAGPAADPAAAPAAATDPAAAPAAAAATDPAVSADPGADPAAPADPGAPEDPGAEDPGADAPSARAASPGPARASPAESPSSSSPSSSSRPRSRPVDQTSDPTGSPSTTAVLALPTGEVELGPVDAGSDGLPAAVGVVDRVLRVPSTLLAGVAPGALLVLTTDGTPARHTVRTAAALTGPETVALRAGLPSSALVVVAPADEGRWTVLVTRPAG